MGHYKVLQFLSFAAIKTTGVNDDTFTGWGFDDIGVFLEGIEGEAMDLEAHGAKIVQLPVFLWGLSL